jgi:hypothetical protein
VRLSKKYGKIKIYDIKKKEYQNDKDNEHRTVCFFIGIMFKIIPSAGEFTL